MQVNVAQLLKEPIGATRDFEFDGPWQQSEQASEGHARGKLRLMRTDDGIWASGPVEVSLDYTCSRCVVPFTSWVKLTVDDVFLPTADVATGARVRLEDDEEPESFRLDEHHVLDLSEAVRQYALAAAPLAPLCREDCKGLCQMCGADLNHGTCDCAQPTDPRWAQLEGLRA